MELERLKLRPGGGRYGELQYALAALMIWSAIGLSLWERTHAPSPTRPLLAGRPAASSSCNPS
ncbi:MAG TPA: hypothetical protein VL460_06805 [Caulobacteraceae bacterium]|jgi:hypothetical protein|nr:hypothetical protein [Caulobacteraceae bacterium]